MANIWLKLGREGSGIGLEWEMPGIGGLELEGPGKGGLEWEGPYNIKIKHN